MILHVSPVSLLVTSFFALKLNGLVTYPCNASASCGCSTNPATLSRIVGGEAASTETWGWAVSLLSNENAQCGGSIISSTWILTVAHCVPRGSTSVIVYAGSNYRFSGTQIVSASKAYVHPNYNESGFIHDIALLELSTPLNLTDLKVNAVCLPFVPAATITAGEWPPVNTTVTAIGWGRLNESASSSSYTLQQVTLETVSYQDPTCIPLMFDWRLQFCAGVVGGGKGTCRGDSGGPVMIFDQQWYVVGIISYGIGCARANYAAGITRVAYYQNWISSTMNGNGTGFLLTTTPAPERSRANDDNQLCWMYCFFTILSCLWYYLTNELVITI